MWGGKYRDKIDVISAVKSVTTPIFPYPIRLNRDGLTGALLPHASQPAEYKPQVPQELTPVKVVQTEDVRAWLLGAGNLGELTPLDRAEPPLGRVPGARLRAAAPPALRRGEARGRARQRPCRDARLDPLLQPLSRRLPPPLVDVARARRRSSSASASTRRPTPRARGAPPPLLREGRGPGHRRQDRRRAGRPVPGPAQHLPPRQPGAPADEHGAGRAARDRRPAQRRRRHRRALRPEPARPARRSAAHRRRGAGDAALPPQGAPEPQVRSAPLPGGALRPAGGVLPRQAAPPQGRLRLRLPGRGALPRAGPPLPGSGRGGVPRHGAHRRLPRRQGPGARRRARAPRHPAPAARPGAPGARGRAPPTRSSASRCGSSASTTASG